MGFRPSEMLEELEKRGFRTSRSSASATFIGKFFIDAKLLTAHYSLFIIHCSLRKEHFMSYTTIGSETIFFSLNESENEQTLVLIHGSGGDHMHWPRVLRNLSGINVCALDLPGHGRSEGDGRTRVEDYADFIDAFVSMQNFRHVTLAGHSLGGAIVLCLGLRSPEWLEKIILVGTGARLRVTPAILDSLLSDFKATIETVCSYAFGIEASESLVRAGREQLLKNRPRIIHGDYSACNQFDIMDKVEKIALPTLIISGSADKLTPLKYGEYLHRHIAGSEFSVIQDAGHMMGLEKPEEFNQIISRFLKKE
jgi:pimeloyl-ACP methyl ester carboxylesterase